MKDSDLLIDPKSWPKHFPCTAEQEISAGSTEALRYKLKYIDNKIAEIEISLDGRLDPVSHVKLGTTIDNLTLWYELIEVELIKRSMLDDLKVTMENQMLGHYHAPSNMFVDMGKPMFNKGMFKVTGTDG